MRTMSLRSIACLVLACLIVGMAGDGRGQDQPAKKPDSGAAQKKASEVRGRLPAHYGAVVSGEQRAKIYAIQARHAEKIQALQAELEAAIEARDAEVEAVLTDEQKQKVAALVAEARKRSAAKKAEATKPAPKEKVAEAADGQ